MKYKVTYTIPFSVDPELREKIFEEEITATDSQSARKKIYGKYHNAKITSLIVKSYL
jgi:hypothetical protein